VTKTINKKLYRLPFDQFSRQFIVFQLTNEIIRTDNQKLKIIDLGGHKGQTKSFQTNDHVTILDIYQEEYEGYVKGDATNLNFNDNEFDLSFSFDVFEHIPREKRQDFIKEALRVSRYGLFLAMPVDNSNRAVSKSEVSLNNFFKSLYGKDHQWLKEHIDYKIPSEKEVDKNIKSSSAEGVSFNSNNLEAWRLMQMAIFMAAKDEDLTKPVSGLNENYNTVYQGIDALDDLPSYRKIYFISRNKKLIEKAQKLKNNRLESKNINQPIEIFSEVSNLIALVVKEKTKKITKMGAVNDKLSIDNFNLRQSIESLQRELSNIYASRSWKYARRLSKAKKITRGQ
jgi:hypothetical protein